MNNDLAEYDRFAAVYHRYWAASSADRMLPIVTEGVLRQLPENATVLDLCCGTGVLTAKLAGRGANVAGVDGSSEMIRIARESFPGIPFEVSDVREFKQPNAFDSILCLYDSLNHLRNEDELRAVFQSIHASLKTRGSFVFDLNSAQGFEARWQSSFNLVEARFVLAARSSYSREARTAKMALTFFERVGQTWQRTDVAFHQRCFDIGVVQEMLASAGFSNVRVLDAVEHLNMRHETGRQFVIGTKL